MDPFKLSAINPTESRLASFAKVLHIRSGISHNEGMQMIKSHDKIKKDEMTNSQIPCFNDELKELKDRVVKEAFLAKLFAGVSSVKAAYAQLQFAQSPYDADAIQSADQIVVSELKNLSELKQSYLKKELHKTSPDSTLLLSEIQEQASWLKTYKITSKKLDSQLKLKASEIALLKEKLAEGNRYNKLLEKELTSSGQYAIPKTAQVSSLKASHFISCAQQAIKSIQTFTQLFTKQMESAGWDLDAAANLIEPGISFWKPNHKSFAFESYVCREMFDGFHHPNLSTPNESMSEHKDYPTRYLERFMEMKSVRVADYLTRKPKSIFMAFLRAKYSKLINPKMEASLFGNMDQANLVNSFKIPETPFFSAFCEMVKCIWLLRCLALSFDPMVSIFQAKKGCRFSEVHMESLSDEVFLLTDSNHETEPWVGFTVFPGFKIGKTIMQCRVYLCRS